MVCIYDLIYYIWPSYMMANKCMILDYFAFQMRFHRSDKKFKRIRFCLMRNFFPFFSPEPFLSSFLPQFNENFIDKFSLRIWLDLKLTENFFSPKFITDLKVLLKNIFLSTFIVSSTRISHNLLKICQQKRN